MGKHTKKAYFALDGSRSGRLQCMFPLILTRKHVLDKGEI